MQKQLPLRAVKLGQINAENGIRIRNETEDKKVIS